MRSTSTLLSNIRHFTYNSDAYGHLDSPQDHVILQDFGAIRIKSKYEYKITDQILETER